MISYYCLVFMVQGYLDVPKLKRAKQTASETQRMWGFKLHSAVSIMTMPSHGDLILS